MDIQSLYKVIHKKIEEAELKEVPNEEKYIWIQKDTIEFEIHFNRIYKDLDGNLKKLKMQFNLFVIGMMKIKNTLQAIKG